MRTPAQDMEGSSIVSRARTAFHSAAAKAERVFTDRKKSDPLTDRDSDRQPPKNANDDSSKFESKGELKYLTKKPAPLKTKQDWQEKLKNIRFGKKGAEDFESPGNSAMSFAIFDENLYLMGMKNAYESKGSEECSSPEGLSHDIIPPASILKQLAIAAEAGKKFKSMKDILATPRDSSPVRERAFSAVKSLVLREKEDKFTAELGGDDDVCSLMHSLLETEVQFPGMKISSGSDNPTNMSILPKDIHGAPPQSFVVKLAEVMGSFKTLRKMAIFWYKVVTQLRRFWLEERYIPGIPPDDGPDLNSCLLYQQLQVINCCISRKKRHSAATESVESAIRQSSSNDEESRGSEGPVVQTLLLYARISTGELVLRLGADKQSENLTMLETGEPVYAPVMQEGPLLTEDLIKETEEFVLRTGSVGAGCSQLLSDMQAFKAANPGCILEDFVRWHSPPDWTESELKEEQTFNDGEPSSAKGQLSSRMQKEGNLWRELWETAKPVPAVNQTPLFDEDLAVEGILSDFENVVPSELLEHLLISLLGSGFTVAEEKLAANESLSKLFFECKDWVVTTCQSCIWMEKVDDICQVYETVHMMLHKPEELLKIMKQPDDAAATSEPKSRFKRLSVIFGSKVHSNGKQSAKDHKSQTFSSIFSKKPPRPDAPSPSLLERPVSSSENDWTIV